MIYAFNTTSSGMTFVNKFPTMPTVHLLDYVAGNVRSLVNAIETLGYTIEWIKEPKDIEAADVSRSWTVADVLAAELCPVNFG